MEKSSEGRALVEEIAVALTYPIYNATQIWAIATCRSFFGLIKFHWVIDEKEIRIISVLSDLKCIIQTYRHDVKTHKIIATHNSSSVFFSQFGVASNAKKKSIRTAESIYFVHIMIDRAALRSILKRINGKLASSTSDWMRIIGR